MYTKAGARETVSFRLGKAQLEWLDSYCQYYNQGRGELIREAVQLWLTKQEKTHPLPNNTGAIRFPDEVGA